VEHRRALQQQLEDRKLKEEEDYRIFLQDKAMIDEVVQKIIEEDKRYPCTVSSSISNVNCRLVQNQLTKT
jgi:hypothetical protein